MTKTVGKIESLWRYPVKSMGGERCDRIFLGFPGVYGDRCYAFKSSAARKGAPYLTATAQEQMLRYRPRFRFPERATEPPNLTDAMSIAPGITYADPDENDLTVDVVTPSGAVVAVDDPRLMEMLREGVKGNPELSLVRSDRALTDCRPVSLISLQTIRQCSTEIAVPLDKRRFRANLYADLASGNGFAEDAWLGRKLQIGAQAVIAILEKDPRCKMISLDPDTAEHNPDILKKVVSLHDNYAGVYGAVLVEGRVTEGDAIVLLD